MDYKEETKRTYEQYPAEFDEKFERHFRRYVRPYAELFIQHLKGTRVLDLGSGPGNHALFFKQHGLNVLCIDNSAKMLELCQQKGLSALCMDIEELDLPEHEYSGAWAYASLLHVPKQKLPPIIERIVRALKPDGILGLALKEGKGEGMETHDSYPGTQRWFSYFTDKEVRALFKNFDILHLDRNTGAGIVFLNYLMRPKNHSTA